MAFLAGRLADERVLVVGTVRDLEVGRSDPVVDALAAIARRPASRRLRLVGLGAADTSELLEQATGAAVGDSIAGAIYERAEGNPFYATELARLLADEDRLDDATAVAVAAIPRGVRDVVRQRLTRLPPATVALARAGCGHRPRPRPVPPGPLPRASRSTSASPTSSRRSSTGSWSPTRTVRAWCASPTPSCAR